MAFLASLLPGVREVRSALFAGYLWIATTYVGVQTWADDNSGTPFDILEARLSQTPQVWEFAVVSVAAYFVGSISRAVFDPVVLYLVDSTAKDIPRLRERVEASSEGNWEPARNRRKRAVRNLRRLRIALDPRISAGQRNALETFLDEQYGTRLPRHQSDPGSYEQMGPTTRTAPSGSTRIEAFPPRRTRDTPNHRRLQAVDAAGPSPAHRTGRGGTWRHAGHAYPTLVQ